MIGQAERRLPEAGIPDLQVRLPFNERPVGIWTIRIVTLAAVLLAWEVYGRTTNPALFTPFSGVVGAFIELGIESSDLWQATWDSLQAMVIGFALAIPAGIAVGVLMGRYRTAEYVLDPYVSFLYAMPTVAIVPLLVIWMGIGATVRIFIVFITSIFPIIVNTMVGAKEVQRELLDVAETFCASERQTLRSVVIPSILPYMFTGIHVAIGSALIAMLLGEMLVVLQGLGGLIVASSNAYRPAHVIVALFVIVAESLILVSLMGWLRRKLMPWSRELGRFGA